METLDKCFENVCELDLIFHMDKVGRVRWSGAGGQVLVVGGQVLVVVTAMVQVHCILNELVMGGMVLETNMTEIMLRIEEQTKIEKEEVSQNTSCVTTHLMAPPVLPRPCPGPTLGPSHVSNSLVT